MEFIACDVMGGMDVPEEFGNEVPGVDVLDIDMALPSD